MIDGERQVAPTREGIRRDHTARYEWVARQLEPQNAEVIDIACGVGYGSQLLAQCGHEVAGIDNDEEAILYARKHYSHENARFFICDMNDIDGMFSAADVSASAPRVAVAFECIEHVEDPRPMLKKLREIGVQRLFASVPNEDVFPHSGPGYVIAFHHRHYTEREFRELLAECGWKVDLACGQRGQKSMVLPDVAGRTLVCDCSPSEGAQPLAKAPRNVTIKVPPPERSVAILGLGPSLEQYVDLAKRLGGRRNLADETWAINALGDVISCDLVIHMDDVRVQMARAKARPESNIANMLDWMRGHKGRIVTSQTHPDFPALEAFPLERVINACGGYAYFNSTASYAVALAIANGFDRIMLFGCDFTYPNSHDAEKGRGCVEFWLGFAAARGIKITVPKTTSLMDAYVPIRERLYGYDCMDVTLYKENGKTVVEMVVREDDIDAEDVERRYDHGTHPNALVEESNQ